MKFDTKDAYDQYKKDRLRNNCRPLTFEEWLISISQSYKNNEQR